MKKKPRVLFNASVVLAGIYSPDGGSGKLLRWVRKGDIDGVVSEIILDEVVSHADKVRLAYPTLEKRVLAIFSRICRAPGELTVKAFGRVVTDFGDAHLFASAKEEKCKYLVSLDKKHVLVLAGKVRELQIVSPKELIEALSF